MKKKNPLRPRKKNPERQHSVPSGFPGFFTLLCPKTTRTLGIHEHSHFSWPTFSVIFCWGESIRPFFLENWVFKNFWQKWPSYPPSRSDFSERGFSRPRGGRPVYRIGAGTLYLAENAESPLKAHRDLADRGARALSHNIMAGDLGKSVGESTNGPQRDL